jgi:hypothetical protein
MRMDIEISPGARPQPDRAVARNDWSLAGRDAAGDGGITGKRFCSKSHLAPLREKRIGRFVSERAKGVLWHHSNVNLAGPSRSHRRRHEFPGATPEIEFGLASPGAGRNMRPCLVPVAGRVNDSAIKIGGCPAGASGTADSLARTRRRRLNVEVMTSSRMS